MSKTKLSFTSADLKSILDLMVAGSSNTGDVNTNNLDVMEQETRFWLLWNRECAGKGFKGHDKSIEELKLRLRLINAYKNALVKDKLAKGF